MSTQTPDFSHLFQTERKELAEMTQEERESAVYDSLLFLEVQIVEPKTASWYLRVKREITDWADRMQADITYWDQIADLRRAGKMKSIEDVRAKAVELSVITDFKELWKAFIDYQKSLPAPQ